MRIATAAGAELVRATSTAGPGATMARDYYVAERPPDELAPVLPWPVFSERVLFWGQDEHIAVIGPTKQGKSNLIRNLLEHRDYAAYLAIKSEDETLDAFVTGGGWLRAYDWPPRRQRSPGLGKPLTWAEAPRRLVWPDARRYDHEAEQKRVFRAALADIWASGRVCVVWDDFWYLSELLGMNRDAKKMLLNARSCKSPQVMAAQRAGGTRMVELTDQPMWVMWARETDPRNLQIVGPANSIRRGFVENLDRYQFLAENTQTGDRYRVTAPLLAA